MRKFCHFCIATSHCVQGREIHTEKMPTLCRLARTRRTRKVHRHSSIDRCIPSHLTLLNKGITDKNGSTAITPPTFANFSASSSRAWPVSALRMLSNLDLVFVGSDKTENHNRKKSPFVDRAPLAIFSSRLTFHPRDHYTDTPF